jgi:hypothetical protein
VSRRDVRCSESAQIDDPPHAGLRGGGREVPGGLDIKPPEVAARRHRMNQVVGNIDINEDAIECLRPQCISRHQFDVRPRFGLQRIEAAGGGAHPLARPKQARHEIRTDEPVRTEYQHRVVRRFGHLGNRHHGSVYRHQQEIPND